MRLRNTESAFGSIARWLHWGMAVLILASLALIEFADVAPRGSALRASIRDWHGQIGLVVLALVWFRLVSRMSDRMPAIVPTPPAWQRAAAHAVEWSFYLLMIVLPILGIVMLQADGKPVSLLGVALPTLVTMDEGFAHRLEDVHEWLGNAMMVLIGVHVIATLFHRFVLRDNTLARMIAPRSRG